MKRHFIIGLVSFGATFFAVPAFAHTDTADSLAEHIESFDSQVRLSRDNVATIHETISYEFGPTPRHGIFRYVPKQTKDAAGNTYYYQFALQSVTDEAGKKYEFSREDTKQNAVIKIGDPDRTITGRHYYRIEYTLTPVVSQNGATDRFNLNITGNGWKIPIDQTIGHLTFEPGIQLQSYQCYTGAQGATEQACHVSPAEDGGYDLAVTGPLPPGSGFTVDANLQTGAVTKYLVANQKPPVDLRDFTGLALAMLFGLFGLFWSLMQWLRYRWQKSQQTIIPQYEPPDKLTPAELGLLNDNRSGMVEVTATLIDLAVRGYLKIEQISPAKLLKKAQYRLTKQKDGTGLTDYESELFEALFGTTASVTLGSLDREKMARAVSSFKTKLQADLNAKGYYATPRGSGKATLLLGLLGTAMIGASVITQIVGQVDVNIIIWEHLGALAVLGFTLYALGRRRTTAAGVAEWAEVAGFKWFLSVTEKDRLKFTDAPKKTPKLFSAMLPYATALGVEKEWAKQFEGIDVSPGTSGWYAGTYALTPYALSNDLSSDFSSVVGQSFSAPSSSSGSSGGGFSGGGGGGGGGGSW